MGEDCEDCAIPPFRGGDVVRDVEVKKDARSGGEKSKSSGGSGHGAGGHGGRVVGSKGRKGRKR